MCHCYNLTFLIIFVITPQIRSLQCYFCKKGYARLPDGELVNLASNSPHSDCEKPFIENCPAEPNWQCYSGFYYLDKKHSTEQKFCYNADNMAALNISCNGRQKNGEGCRLCDVRLCNSAGDLNKITLASFRVIFNFLYCCFVVFLLF